MIPTPFRWGPPTFNAGEGFTMMAASFVALVEVCSLNNQIFSAVLSHHIWNHYKRKDIKQTQNK